MFTDKLKLGRPQDISARMDLINSAGEVVYERLENGQDGEPGWLEFYSAEAEAVRRFGRSVAAEELLKERRASRSKKRDATLSEMEREIEGYEGKAVEGLAIRLKAWRLVSADGEVLDIPCTKENAQQLFGHPEYGYLKQAALEFCGDPENFFTKRRDS